MVGRALGELHTSQLVWLSTLVKSPPKAETERLWSLVFGREGRKWQRWHLQVLDLPPNSVRDFSGLEQVNVQSKPPWAQQQHKHPLPSTSNLSAETANGLGRKHHFLCTWHPCMPPSPKVWAVFTYQPPSVAVLWDEGILWGQERLHSWVKPLIEPEGMTRLWNARVTAARSPGVLEEFLDMLWELHNELPGVPRGGGHLVGVVQQKRRRRDEQEDKGEHLHIPLP